MPTYNELIVVAREEDVRSRGPLLRRFMRALALGHEALRDDAGKAVDELVKANPDLDRKLQRAQVKATLPVFFPRDEEQAVRLAGSHRMARVHPVDARQRAARRAPPAPTAR